MFRCCLNRGLLVCLLLLSAGPTWAASPKNVIFMVGDGMGPNHVRAGGMYLTGAEGSLSFESFPYHGVVTTYSASASVTDSAAAATAMATGNKVNNGVISMAYPGDGSELQTLLEVYKARGVRTGLVTTDAMTGATPGGFGAHEPSRDNRSQIATDFLTQTKPNVLLGGGGNGISVSAAQGAGYTAVTTGAGMLGIDANLVSLLSGQFGTSNYMRYEYDGLGDQPHLWEMTAKALDILDNDPGGFFLMVEGGNIDHASHDHDIARAVPEVIAFHDAVQTVITWAGSRTDTLILVTADHETGGLSIVQNNGQGVLPAVNWTASGHTATNVGAWARGVNAEYITGTLNNTDFFQIIIGSDPVIVLSPPGITRSVAWAHTLPANTDSFTLSNGGMGTYHYTVTSDQTWVWADPGSGDCSTETDTIWLVYDVAALAPGEHVAHLEVASVEDPTPETFTMTLTVRPVPGDFDVDNDVDQEDFGHLQACLTGSAGAPVSGCENADLNLSGRIDSVDIGVLQACMSGPGVDADPFCAD